MFTPDYQLFYDAFKACPLGIAVENLEGQPLFVNPALCAMLGFSEDEILKKHCVEFSPPDDAEKDWALFEQLRTGSIDHYQLEKRYFRRDGSFVWGRLSISLLNHRPSPLVVAMVEDITEKRRAEDERKLAEDTLRESEARFRLATQAGKMYAYEWDLITDRIVRCGDISGVLGSASQASLTREQLLARVHPDDRGLFNGSVNERTPENPDVQISYRLLRPDGTVEWLEKTAHAFFDQQGRMVRMIGMVADITERKRAEDAIRDGEMRYRRIVETTNEGVWLLDSKLQNSYVNLRMAEMLGYEPEEMLGRSVFDFYFPWDIERKKQALRRRQEGLREQIEDRLQRRDGSELWVRMAAAPVFKDNGEFDGAFAMVSDITERKRAEETLRESEEKFRSVFRDAGVGMVIVSPAGRFLAANKTFCDCLGYTEQELLKRTVESVTLPEDWPAFSQKLQEALTEGHGFKWYNKRCLHKSGRIVFTESTTSLIRASDGAPKYFVAEILDVTSRKEAEDALSAMTRKLIEAQEQERARIGRELHDDINQRLAMLSVELEQMQLAPSDVHSRVEELRKRVTEISNDVQALSHDLHSSKLEYLGVVAGIRGWCKEFSERERMEVDFRGNVLSVLPPEVGVCLFRVLQEALHNAAKHCGVKRMEVQLLEDCSEIHLIVRDFGRGFEIDAAMQGSGLGLISMRERVRLVNGTIAIDSKPMGGTTVHARVPFKASTSTARATG
jgi:PAS domain S-box-containing protein